MSKKPLGSSTPNFYPRVARRRGVHSYNEEDDLSPVTFNRSGTASPETRSPYTKRRTFLTSSDLDDTEESEGEISSQNPSLQKSYSDDRLAITLRSLYHTPECAELEKVKHYDMTSQYSYMFFATFVLVVVAAVICLGNNAAEVTLDDIREEFPLQDRDFWIALDSGLKEVIKFEKPSVFLLLYKENGENLTDRLLGNISTYASCILNNNCEKKPIILSSEELNNDLLKQDGGYLLTAYKSDLEEVKVMIVKNLGDVPGYAARVLHSFCDEHSPAVKKSVFFLTMKVAEFPEKKSGYVRSLLREKWEDIKEDHFDPLFTRISGMILSIRS